MPTPCGNEYVLVDAAKRYCNTPPQLERQSDQAEYQIMRFKISTMLIRLMKL